MREWAYCYLEKVCPGREKSRCKGPEAGVCGQSRVDEREPRRWGLRGGGCGGGGHRTWWARVRTLALILISALWVGCIGSILQIGTLRHKVFLPPGRSLGWDYRSVWLCASSVLIVPPSSGAYGSQVGHLHPTMDSHLWHLSLGCLNEKWPWISPSSTPQFHRWGTQGPKRDLPKLVTELEPTLHNIRDTCSFGSNLISLHLDQDAG